MKFILILAGAAVIGGCATSGASHSSYGSSYGSGYGAQQGTTTEDIYREW